MKTPTNATAAGAAVISWDVYENTLSDGSLTHDVIGTSDESRVTFYCADEASAEELVALLNSHRITGAAAESTLRADDDMLDDEPIAP